MIMNEEERGGGRVDINHPVDNDRERSSPIELPRPFMFMVGAVLWSGQFCLADE